MLLDDDLLPIGIAPFQTVASQKFTSYDLAFLAFADSLWFFGNYQYSGFAKPLDCQESDPCKCNAEILEFKNRCFEKAKSFRTGSPQNYLLLNARKLKWSFIVPLRSLETPKSSIQAGRILPFAKYDISERKGKFAIKRSKDAVSMVPASNATQKNQYLYGFSNLAMVNGSIVWADYFNPRVYRFSTAGVLLDSLLLAAPVVQQDKFYLPGQVPLTNKIVNEMLMSTSFYFGLIASDRYLVRNIHLAGGEEGQSIVHNLGTGKSAVVRYPKTMHVNAILGDKLVFSGYRVGDRIAFPYLSLIDF